jgi:hypothetical protein
MSPMGMLVSCCGKQWLVGLGGTARCSVCGVVYVVDVRAVPPKAQPKARAAA